MLLRSITKHVKDQNWFAVFIDFLIVVVGVFIGIQVANWNTERIAQENEGDFLNRLHKDVIELQDRRKQYDLDRPFLMNTFQEITDFLYGRQNDLSQAVVMQVEFTPGIKPVSGLPESLVCNSIDWSNAMTVPPALLPTAAELVSAGRINDISSIKLKDALQTYLQQSNRAEVYTHSIRQEAVSLSSEYPDLFDIRSHEWENFEDLYGETYLKYSCDYSGMRENKAFLNAFAVNVNTFTNYANRSVRTVSEKLDFLHTVIDKELGLSHESDEGNE